MERLEKREGRVKKGHKVCDRVRWEDRRKRRMWKEGRGKGWRVRSRDCVRGGVSNVKGSEEKGKTEAGEKCKDKSLREKELYFECHTNQIKNTVLYISVL